MSSMIPERDERSLSALIDESVVHCKHCGRPFLNNSGRKSHERVCDENPDSETDNT